VIATDAPSPAPASARLSLVPVDDLEGHPQPRGTRWTWVAIGGAAVAGGLALDLLPSSARNHSFDVLDLVPLILYAAGGSAILAGVF
jgi:uncharacterized protein YjeT (DUF2065 family)